MRRLLPPSDHSPGHALDVSDDAPDGSADLTDEELLHEYAYPAGHRWLRANMVSSADGVATVAGLSAGLSGPIDKRVFGILRALADVVIAGAGTARIENYRGARVAERFVDLRASLGQRPVPPIALVSRHLDLDPGAAIFADSTERTIILTCAGAPAARRASLARVADIVEVGDTDVDLSAALAALEERGHARLLCEGGPSLLHDLTAAELVDELCLTTSPQLVGGGERHLLHGGPITPPPSLRLVGVLEEDGVLLSRYLVEH